MTDIKIPNKILDSFNTRQEVDLRKLGDAVYDGVLEKLQDSGDLLISNLGDVSVLNPDDRDLLQFDFGLQEWVNVPIEEIYAPQITNVVFAGPTTGSPAFPAFRSLVEADIPAIPSTKISDSTVIGRSLVTAANAAAGRTAIGAAADAEVVKLTGTQTIFGNKTFIDVVSVGTRVITGQNTSVMSSSSVQSPLQINSISFGVPAGFAAWQFSGANAGGPAFYIGKSRGTTVGQQVALVDGDGLGALFFEGSDGTAMRRSAGIFVGVDGTPSAGVVPGRIDLQTTNSSGVSGTRVRIDRNGNAGFGGNTSPSCSLDTNGFTKLGESGPKIKQKKLTGTTGAAGSTTNLVHGLTQGKIIGIQPLVYDGLWWWPPGGSVNASARLYSCFVGTTSIAFELDLASTVIANQPCKVLITYEE